MRSNTKFHQAEGAAEQNFQNNSSKIQTLSINSNLKKARNHTSGLFMVVGLLLLIVGTLFSNALLVNGLEGIVLTFITVGFSMIYYGVSEDNL